LKIINDLFRRIEQRGTRYVYIYEHIAMGFDHIRSTFSSKAVQSSTAALRRTLFTPVEIVNDLVIDLPMWNNYSARHLLNVTLVLLNDNLHNA
jgi:hypothetical protein